MSGSPQTQQDALFPIREVSRLTGVNSITLRAWERRYNLIEPVRTDSGHRLYTQQHIEILKQVVELTQQGIAISRVKPLLKTLKTTEEANRHTEDSLQESLEKALEKADITRLNSLLDILLSDYPQNIWINILQRLTLKLGAAQHKLQQPLWEAVLLPRLQSRFHHSLRSLPQLVHPTVLFANKQTSPVSTTLAMLDLSQQGEYPLQMKQPAMQEEALLKILQQYQCQGIAVVDDSEEPDSLDMRFWESWTKAHPSFQIWFYLNQPLPSSLQQMQVKWMPLITIE